MPKPHVHPTAIIDQGAVIGENTYIWHFCHLMPGAIVGAGCILGQNVFIDNNAEIGNEVKIQNNVSVYNSVKISDKVFIGPSVVFTNVINPRSFIERKSEFKSTTVHTGVSIGANATILCGVEIGQYAMIGAGAVVTKNVLPYSIVVGNPAHHAGWVSESGDKLSFDEKGLAQCKIDNKKYQLLNNRVMKVNE